MPQYAQSFLKDFTPNKRAYYQTMIERGTAYFERAEDGSQLLVIIDPGGKDEAVWAAMPGSDKPMCIGNRVR